MGFCQAQTVQQPSSPGKLGKTLATKGETLPLDQHTHLPELLLPRASRGCLAVGSPIGLQKVSV